MGERAKRVLLVEDDPDSVRAIRRCLPEAAFEIVHAPRLDTALSCLAHEHFDAVLTDLSLPDSRGPDTFRRVEEQFPDVPVVVVSGSYDESVGIAALQHGAQDFLRKNQFDGPVLQRSLLHAIARQRLQADLRNLALRDPLTGLYNRRGLSVLAEHQLSLARREGRSLVAVAVDVDGFKGINDTYGHEEGDRALLRMARVLRRTFRGPDVLARVGGDEFVVIAAGVPGDSAIALIAGRLRAQLKSANRSEGAPHLSISIGVSTLAPGSATTVKEVLAAADHAMYDDKRRRRGHGLRLLDPPQRANGSGRWHRAATARPRRKNA